MSVPPPPPTGPPMDGFFGGPVRPPAAQYGLPTPAPVFGGYAPPATFAPPAVVGATSAGPRVPEPVTVACTLLGVFAAIGAFTVLVVVVLAGGSSGSSSSSGSGSASDIGLGAVYGVLWGGSAFINTALIVFLRQGNPVARTVTGVVCGLWTLYWLRTLYQLSNAASGLLFGGSLVHLAELLLLGLAVASALPAVLLWRESSQRHFA